MCARHFNMRTYVITSVRRTKTLTSTWQRYPWPQNLARLDNQLRPVYVWPVTLLKGLDVIYAQEVDMLRAPNFVSMPAVRTGKKAETGTFLLPLQKKTSWLPNKVLGHLLGRCTLSLSRSQIRILGPEGTAE